MTTQQIKLVKDLEELKNKIRLTQDRKEINSYIMQAIQMATPVEPRLVYISSNEGTPYYQGKASIINLLKNEAQHLSNYLDIEDVHFQISGTLTMLMTKFVDGIHGIEQALNVNSNISV